MRDWFGRTWRAREAVGRGLLGGVELTLVLALFGWTLAGLVGYGRKTGWSMDGLLSLVDAKWRGALILGLVLFGGSVRRFLGRLASLKIGDNELTFGPQFDMRPSGAAETIDLMPSAAAETIDLANGPR